MTIKVGLIRFVIFRLKVDQVPGGRGFMVTLNIQCDRPPRFSVCLQMARKSNKHPNVPGPEQIPYPTDPLIYGGNQAMRKSYQGRNGIFDM